MKHVISTGQKTMQASVVGRIEYRGFSLVELMVAMTIASIVMAAIYSVYAGLTRSYTTQTLPLRSSRPCGPPLILWPRIL